MQEKKPELWAKRCNKCSQKIAGKYVPEVGRNQPRPCMQKKSPDLGKKCRKNGV